MQFHAAIKTPSLNTWKVGGSAERSNNCRISTVEIEFLQKSWNLRWPTFEIGFGEILCRSLMTYSITNSMTKLPRHTAISPLFSKSD